MMRKRLHFLVPLLCAAAVRRPDLVAIPESDHAGVGQAIATEIHDAVGVFGPALIGVLSLVVPVDLYGEDEDAPIQVTDVSFGD